MMFFKKNLPCRIGFSYAREGGAIPAHTLPSLYKLGPGPGYNLSHLKRYCLPVNVYELGDPRIAGITLFALARPIAHWFNPCCYF